MKRMKRIKRLPLLLAFLPLPFSLWADELPPGWTEDLFDPEKPYCHGGYLAAEVPVVEEGLRIRVQQISHQNETLQLKGNVEIVADQLLLRGEEALYSKPEGRIELIGPARLDSPSLIAETDRVFYLGKKDELTLGTTRFSLPELHAWGQADSLSRHQSLIELEGARFSFCDPQEETWHMRAEELSLNLATMQGNARNIRLVAGRVPFLYLPYLAFPLGNQRQSGLLYPYFAIDQTNGFTYSQPIYFNLAPQMDTTSYLHLIQRRGFLLEQEFRWLASFGEGELGFGYLPYDELLGEKRSAQHLEFSSNLIHGWSGDLLFTRLGDFDYVEDLPHFFAVEDDVALPRRFHIAYGSPQLEWTFGLRDYQLLDEQGTRPYKQLPFTSFSYFSPVWQGTYFYNDAEYILFDGQAEAPFYYEGDNGRLHNTLGFGWDNYFDWGFLHSGGNLHTNYYSLDNQTLDYSLRNLYLDGGLEFSRFINGWCPCQLIFQPRLYALWADGLRQDHLPVFDTSLNRPSYDMLFSSTQFSGNDRFANADRLSLGLEGYIINLEGEQVYRMRLGQARYRNPQELFLFNETLAADDRSPWLVDMSWRLTERGYLEWSLAHDEEQLVQQGLALKYTSKKNSGWTLSYYEDIHLNSMRRQLAGHFAWQLRPRWSLFGEVHYDIEAERTPIALSGFSYENCCIRTHFGAYERLRDSTRQREGEVREGREESEERERGIALQFFLKPLGGGQVGHNFLASRIENIYGAYEEPY